MISIIPYSPKAVLVQWKGGISKTTISEISRFDTLIQKSGVSAITETIPAFTSIIVCYRESKFSEIKIKLEKLYAQQDTSTLNLTHQSWQLPILLLDELSIDIQRQTGLGRDAFYKSFLNTRFTIGMKGFLPGFIYMAGLPKELHVPRKSIPDLTIEKGSVAIGGQQCGIYPNTSPGGWHIIGNCPIPLIDIEDKELSCFHVGDTIRFKSITQVEHALYGTTDWTFDMIISQFSNS